MKPNARRYRRFEDDRGVVYLVPRPPLRWHPAPFWRGRDWPNVLAAGVIAGGIFSAGVAAGAIAIHFLS